LTVVHGATVARANGTRRGDGCRRIPLVPARRLPELADAFLTGAGAGGAVTRVRVGELLYLQTYARRMLHPGDRVSGTASLGKGEMADAGEHENQVWERLTRLMVLTDRIQGLVRRTRARRWQIPMLCLAGPPNGGSLLPELNRLLNNRGRQIPHAYLNATNVTLESLLRQAGDELKRNKFGSKPLRFRHFLLLCQVLNVDLRDFDVEEKEKVLARKLAENYRVDRANLHSWQQVPSFVAAVTVELLIRTLPGLLLRLRNRRRMRWFKKQQYEASGRRMSFLSLAAQLTVGARDVMEPAALRRLLVAAFVRDVAVLYRGNRRRWQWTAYPILLLEGVREANAGGQLMDAINDLRNDSADDPLLVIAATDPNDRADLAPLADLESRYDTWCADLPEARRRNDGRAWYLRVGIPGDLVEAARKHSQFGPPPRQWIFRPALRLSAFVLAPLLVVAGAAPWSIRAVEAWTAGCAPYHLSGHVEVTVADKQCVGFSDNAVQPLGSDPTSRDLESQVFQENDHVDQRAREHPDRPRLTVVYLTSFTLPDPSSGAEQYVAEQEGLSGIARAQRQANVDADLDPLSPYVKIVVANAGQQGAQAGIVIPMIIRLAHADGSVLAVIAAVDSRSNVIDALGQLSDNHLMVITPTMTADHVAPDSKLFLRMSPANLDGARLVHHYVTAVLKRRGVYNFYTYGKTKLGAKDQDLYVDTLRDDLRAAFGDGYSEAFWGNGDSVRHICADQYPGVVFFGGRYTEFHSFLNQVAADCGPKLPVVVADGSTVRFLAITNMRANVPPNLPLAFLAEEGYLGSCAQLASSRVPEQRLYLKILGDQCTKGPLGVEAAGWAMMSFDATRMLIRAVHDAVHTVGNPGSGQTWDPAAINSAMLYQAIQQRSEAYPAVSGPIAFDRDGTAVDRYLSVLCVRDITTAYADLEHVPAEVDRQGQAYPNTPAPSMTPCAS
jgi:hypothetical protein